MINTWRDSRESQQRKWNLGFKMRAAVPWLKRLVAGLTPRRPGFAPGLVHVEFVEDKMALGQIFLRLFGFPLSIYHYTTPLLHAHLSPPHEVCDSSDQTAQYHHLGPKLGASPLTRHLDGMREEVFIYLK
jgi:hypothetical protein